MRPNSSGIANYFGFTEGVLYVCMPNTINSNTLILELSKTNVTAGTYHVQVYGSRVALPPFAKYYPSIAIGNYVITSPGSLSTLVRSEDRRVGKEYVST